MLTVLVNISTTVWESDNTLPGHSLVRSIKIQLKHMEGQHIIVTIFVFAKVGQTALFYTGNTHFKLFYSRTIPDIAVFTFIMHTNPVSLFITLSHSSDQGNWCYYSYYQSHLNCWCWGVSIIYHVGDFYKLLDKREERM